MTNDFHNLSFIWLLSLFIGNKADLLTSDSIKFFPFRGASYEISSLQFDQGKVLNCASQEHAGHDYLYYITQKKIVQQYEHDAVTPQNTPLNITCL